MIGLRSNKYREVFGFRAFRFFWLGFSFSIMGDFMTRVALTWFVYDLTDSARALGLLAVTYTGPVIIGGFVAGSLLDRFDRRKVMMVDSVFRGAVVLLMPVLYALDALELWHIYCISAVYGSLMMITLAGSPSLVPDLVGEEHLDTANALETLSYTLSGVVGPLIAGLLISLIGAPNVVAFDALTYFGFAAVLFLIRPEVATTPTASVASDALEMQVYRLSDAVRLLLRNRVLLSTTLMFMAANIGLGALFVWLPILSDRVLDGGSTLYGSLLGAMAVGEVISAVLAGALKLPIRLGFAICLAQIMSGVSLGIMMLGNNVPIAVVSLVLLGFFSAPLTIWAQTLRMKIIPDQLRGRAFALLRTLMQSANPAGGALGGALLPLLTIPIMIAVSAAFIGLPGLLGAGERELRAAD